jgi:hypothetical protein
VTAIVVVGIAFALLAVSPDLLRGYMTWWRNLSRESVFIRIFVGCMLWAPLEVLFLVTLGTTPGKWIFGIHLRDEYGKKLKPKMAVNRTFSVYVQGLGAGLPIVSFLTLILSYRRLKLESITPWDERLGTDVIHSEWGPVRWVVVMVAVILLAALPIYNLLKV